MADRLVTIRKFPNYISAEMARQTLQDHGIKAVVGGDNAANILPVPAFSEPELQVMQSQAEKAREILDKAEKEI